MNKGQFKKGHKGYWFGKRRSKETISKIKLTEKEQFRNGIRKPWNKGLKGDKRCVWNEGLTKDTNAGIKKISDSKKGKTFKEIAKNVNPEEWKKKVARHGENNGSWRGGISWYHGKDWKAISKSYRKKNPICKKCNKKVKIVHHILPYIVFKSDKELMSLCRGCHRSIENLLDKFFKITPRKDWSNPESVETIRQITKDWLVNDIVRTANIIQ